MRSAVEVPDRTAGRRAWWLPLPPAVLLALLGGLLISQSQPLWYDELYTAAVAPVPLGELARAVLEGRATASYLVGIPPSYSGPYYAVVHVWLALTPFGADEVGLRALSLVASVAAVAVLTVAVRRLAGPAVGLAAGLLAAANPLVVEYSAEARGYGLALLATAVTALGLARWLTDGRRLLYAAGAVAMGLAHWFALPVLAGFAAAAVLLRRRAALPLVAITGAAALPALALVALAVVNGAGGDNVSFIRDTGGRVPWLALRAWSAGSALLIVGTLVALVVGAVRGGRAAVVALAWVGIPLLAVTAAELARPVFVPRYLLPTLLGLAVLAALGTATWRRPVAVAATGALVAASLAAGAPLLDRGPREDTRAVVAFLADEVPAGQPVVAVDERAALALVHYGEELDDVILLPDDAPPTAEVVWLVRQRRPGGLHPSDDDDQLAGRGLRVVRSWEFPGSNTPLVVQRWAR